MAGNIGMPSRSDFPGLQRKPSDKNGFVALHWVAPRRAINAGYTRKTVPLRGFTDGSPELRERCQQLWLEMEAWMAKRGRTRKHDLFDGTIGSLVRIYQAHPFSPYKELKDQHDAF